LIAASSAIFRTQLLLAGKFLRQNSVAKQVLQNWAKHVDNFKTSSSIPPDTWAMGESLGAIKIH
jgi:hypothetical protein